VPKKPFTFNSLIKLQRTAIAVIGVIVFLLLSAFSSLAQDITVSGKITDDDGETLPGVNIVIKGTTIGTITDVDGNYRIQVPNQSSILVFSFIGFKTQEVTVANQTQINIALKIEIAAMEEVVVIGYGSVKKRDLTGAVSSIKSEELMAVPVTSVDQALQGRVAGLVVTQTSGEPGGGTSIRIRGTSSILAGNEPLYVIDGVILSDQSLSTGQSAGNSFNPLSTINPSDIESVEILKDASASAIYGTRATNGVILITTKRGQEGKANINLNYYYGIQQVRDRYELLDASEFGFYQNEANFNAGNGRIYSPSFIDSIGTGTDWQEEIFRDAPMQSLELSFNGGTKNLLYAVSGSFFTQDGVIEGSNFDRINFRANLDGQINSKLKVGNNLLFSRIQGDRVESDDNGTFDAAPVSAALTFNPMLPVFDSDGNFITKNYVVDNNGNIVDGTGPGQTQEEVYSTFANPVAQATGRLSQSAINRIIESLYVSYQIIDGLEARASFSVDAAFSKEDNFVPASSRSGGDSFVLTGSQTSLNWLSENTVSYNSNFGRHSINAVAGFTAQKFKIEAITQTAFDVPNEYTGFYDLSVGTGISTGGTSLIENTVLSFLGRVNYILDDKYPVTVSRFFPVA